MFGNPSLRDGRMKWLVARCPTRGQIPFPVCGAWEVLRLVRAGFWINITRQLKKKKDAACGVLLPFLPGASRWRTSVRGDGSSVLAYSSWRESSSQAIWCALGHVSRTWRSFVRNPKWDVHETQMGSGNSGGLPSEAGQNSEGPTYSACSWQLLKAGRKLRIWLSLWKTAQRPNLAFVIDVALVIVLLFFSTVGSLQSLRPDFLRHFESNCWDLEGLSMWQDWWKVREAPCERLF